MSENQRPKSSIRGNEIPPISDQTTRFQGFLKKEGGNWKSWQRRLFVLSNDGMLSYYEDVAMKTRKGTLNCREAEVHPLTDAGGLYFEIATDVFHLEPGRVFKLLAENENQRSEWIQEIKSVSCLYGDSTSNQGQIDDDEESQPIC